MTDRWVDSDQVSHAATRSTANSSVIFPFQGFQTHHRWGRNVDDGHGAWADVIHQLAEDGAIGQSFTQILW